jgi:hypothetical protein
MAVIDAKQELEPAPVEDDDPYRDFNARGFT